MRTCWCPVERNPYWPTPAAALPAPNHRRDQHFHTTRSRTRAGWGQPPASLPLHSSGAPSPGLAIPVVEPLKHSNEAVGHSQFDNLAIHQAQLHPDLRFDIGSELNRRSFFKSLMAFLVHLLFRANGERECGLPKDSLAMLRIERNDPRAPH